MKFKTLIDVANDNIDIMIAGIKSDGTEIGFDFVKNAWRDDNVFDKNRVIKISELKLLRVYRFLENILWKHSLSLELTPLLLLRMQEETKRFCM